MSNLFQKSLFLFTIFMVSQQKFLAKSFFIKLILKKTNNQIYLLEDNVLVINEFCFVQISNNQNVIYKQNTLKTTFYAKPFQQNKSRIQSYLLQTKDKSKCMAIYKNLKIKDVECEFDLQKLTIEKRIGLQNDATKGQLQYHKFVKNSFKLRKTQEMNLNQNITNIFEWNKRHYIFFEDQIWFLNNYDLTAYFGYQFSFKFQEVFMIDYFTQKYLIFKIDNRNIKITEINTSNSFNNIKNIKFEEGIEYIDQHIVVLNESDNKIKVIQLDQLLQNETFYLKLRSFGKQKTIGYDPLNNKIHIFSSQYGLFQYNIPQETVKVDLKEKQTFFDVLQKYSILVLIFVIVAIIIQKFYQQPKKNDKQELLRNRLKKFVKENSQKINQIEGIMQKQKDVLKFTSEMIGKQND